MHIDDIL